MRLPVQAVATTLICATWISICAAAPEFIWQGLRLALAHFDRTELLAALLVGLVLAFFIEPLMERLRNLLSHSAAAEHAPRDALFTAVMGLIFALASICLHDALKAYVANDGAHAGLNAGIALTIAWALVPFAVAVAWLSARVPGVVVATGVLAAASPWIAGWLFQWSVRSVLVTWVPCLAILGLGYRQVLHGGSHGLVRFAGVVGRVGAAWLILVLLVDAVMALLRLERFALYGAADFWVDVRFYAGWVLGLLLAPAPPTRATNRTPPRLPLA